MTAPARRLLEKRALLLLLFESWNELRRARETNSLLPLPQRRVLSEAESRLRTDFLNAPSTGELARDAGLSPAYFARLFKRQTGQSVHQFITGLRLDKAHLLLIENRLHVSDVAREVGFEDQFYFSRLFTRRFGVAPSALRNTHKMM